MNKIVKKTGRFTVAMLCLVVVGLFIAYGCEKPDTPSDGDGKDSIKPALSLEGTKWKLAGIVDEETGNIRVLEPKDCEECYTLTFDTDSTATVHSISKDIKKMNLFNLTPSVSLPDMLFPEYYYKDSTYYMDADVFCRSVITTYCYTVISEELRLYHYDACGRVSYLRFKKNEL